MTARDNDSISVPSLDRMDKILRLLAVEPTGVSPTEICKRIAIPKSSGYRILASLQEGGYVSSTDGNRTYRLGPILYRLARRALSEVDLAELARPYLAELANRLNETSKISVAKGNQVEVIACVESSSKLRISVAVGEDFPMHAGAASKVLLAFLPEQIRENVISSNLPRFTPNTIVDRTQLYEVLAQIRSTRIAYDNEEFVEGIRAVASPIFDFAGAVIAAISVAYLAAEDRHDEVRINRQRVVLEIAQAISLRLGASPEPAGFGVGDTRPIEGPADGAPSIPGVG